MELKLDGNVFDADLERTRTYYQSNTLCTCAYCRCYRENIRQRYPKLVELLERFGADAARPDETEPYEQDGMIEYAAVHYTVSGAILAGSKKETRLADAETLRLIFEPGGKDADAYYPSEQEEPFFYITVRGVKLSSAWAAAPADKRSFPAFLREIFRRKTKHAPRTIPPIPDDATLAAEMSRQAPDYPLGQTIRVFYSPDKMCRAVLLQRKDKLFTYHLERLEIVSEEDRIYLSRGDKHPRPAMWRPDYSFGPSLFGSEAEALRELQADPKTQGWTIDGSLLSSGRLNRTNPEKPNSPKQKNIHNTELP